MSVRFIKIFATQFFQSEFTKLFDLYPLFRNFRHLKFTGSLILNSHSILWLIFIHGNRSGQGDGTVSKPSLEVNKWIFWSIFYLSKSILASITNTGKRAINSQTYQQCASYANVGWILVVSSFSHLRQTCTSKKFSNETKV